MEIKDQRKGLSFGRHKGVPLSQVRKDYLEWALSVNIGLEDRRMIESFLGMEVSEWKPAVEKLKEERAEKKASKPQRPPKPPKIPESLPGDHQYHLEGDSIILTGKDYVKSEVDTVPWDEPEEEELDRELRSIINGENLWSG